LVDLLGHTHIGELGIMAAQEIVLFQSDLQPGGAVYRALARGQLGPATIG